MKFSTTPYIVSYSLGNIWAYITCNSKYSSAHIFIFLLLPIPHPGLFLIQQHFEFWFSSFIYWWIVWLKPIVIYDNAQTVFFNIFSFIYIYIYIYFRLSQSLHSIIDILMPKCYGKFLVLVQHLWWWSSLRVSFSLCKICCGWFVLLVLLRCT